MGCRQEQFATKMAEILEATKGSARSEKKTNINKKGELQMSMYKVIFDDEEQDEVFETEEDAVEYALYLRSCDRQGAETLHWSNPGDYDYDEDTYEAPDFEIVEED